MGMYWEFWRLPLENKNRNNSGKFFVACGIDVESCIEEYGFYYTLFHTTELVDLCMH